MLFTSGETQFYGAFEVSGTLYTLDDALILGKSDDGALYSILTILKRPNDSVALELARLYRASEIKGGPFPYHAKQEVLWSNRVEEIRLSDIAGEIRCATLETRRAFISRSDFPSNAYFYHSPEVYWASTENSSILPRQVDQRPIETKTSVFRRMLPEYVVLRARAMKRAPIDDDSSLTGSNGSNTTMPETEDSVATKHDLDLTQEESQLTIDLGKSNDGLNDSTHRKRLRRLASVNEFPHKSMDSIDFGNGVAQASIPREDSTLLPFGDSPIVLDEDTNDIEPIETPPPATASIKKAKAMWTLEPTDDDDLASYQPPSTSRDKDDWVSKQTVKSDDPSSIKSSRKERTLVRPSLTQVDTHDITRTTQLAKANNHLNNYAAYATEDGQETTKDPPKPTSNIRSYFSQSPSKPTKPTTKLVSTGIATLVDSDDEDGNDFTKHITSSPSSSGEKPALATKTWHPPGPKQSTISFAKAPKNALDSAVLTTGSLKGSVAPSTPESKQPSRNSTSATSSSKKKSKMPLMVAGIASTETTPSKLRGNGKSSPTKTKKRSREGEEISDDEGNSAFFASLGVKMRKLGESPSSKDPIRSVDSEFDRKTKLQREREDQEDRDGAAEMEGFIVDDDDEIEYDNKIRFADEEPTNNNLEGYMDLDRPSAVGSHSSIDIDTAFLRYFQYLISSVINPAFASTYAGEGSKRDAYFSPAIRKVRDKINAIKDGLLASSVWSSELQAAIDEHPTAKVILEKTTGGVELVCQVCRRKHTCPKIVQLSGVPYDCEAFWNGIWIDNPSEGEEVSLKSIRAGQTCSARVLAYHQLQHLQYSLVATIRPKVAKMRVELLDNGANEEDEELEIQILNELLEQTSWLEELRMRVERHLETALEYGLKVSTRTETHDDFSLALQNE